ncbi:KH domain-containing protein [Candidatus Curtissbacteria bacterium]|nr:KH domain-containing protein [Candidatus Curtissbacteria bacterium]
MAKNNNLEDKILDQLEKILSRLNVSAEITAVSQEDGSLRFNIESADSSILIGRHGENLDSLQTILHAMLYKLFTTEELPDVVIDVDNWKTNRESELKDLAAKVVQKVKFSNKPQSLSNLKPFERRIVHLTLENNPDVETRSEGEGRFRKLIVSPKA